MFSVTGILLIVLVRKIDRFGQSVFREELPTFPRQLKILIKPDYIENIKSYMEL